ncbi:MAG: hemerythrin domain-containing protein [Gammaproteobacteria bacterium]|nr:hemerythrin domain-containing protein [Gammaproteobacteria bacterium]
MNIYEYIKQDHRKVADLFQQLYRCTSPSQKKQIIGTIGQELLVHLEAEQETFYQALERRAPTKAEAQQGEKEHLEIENQLSKVLNWNETETTWEQEVKKLQRLVDHHVAEEEGVLHNLAKEVLTAKEAMSIKEDMQARKEKILENLKKKKKKKKSA